MRLVRCEACICIEPNSESFDVLTRNIHSNNFDHIIKPVKAAMSDPEGLKASIPVKSSPYNAVRTQNQGDVLEAGEKLVAYESVETRTLESIISENNIKNIDILKIDSEGYEFIIIPSLSPWLLNRIKVMRDLTAYTQIIN